MAIDLSQLPGAQQAVQYVLAQVAAWEQVPERLQVVNGQAMAIQGLAQQKGDGATAAAMGQVIQATGPIQSQVTSSAPLLGQVLAAANGGAFDTGTVAAALRLAAMVSAGLAATRQLEQAVTDAGATLTPDQRAALAIQGVPSAGPGWGAWILGALAVLAGVTVVRRRRRGR